MTVDRGMSRPIITFDLEEWFHLLALETDSIPTMDAWGSMESRVEAGTERLLALLERHGIRASFYCLGWIADRHPELLRKVARAGHHVGCHSYAHSLVYTQSRAEFRDETRRAIDTIANVISAPVDCYRAPVFSIRSDCLWALDVLLELGIRVDSSMAPGRYAGVDGGLGFPSGPFRLSMAGGVLDEFPVTMKQVGPFRAAVAGGGYFRLLPLAVIARWTSAEPYVMTYFHPRDFDPGQPVVAGLSRLRRFRSYVGLRGALAKLDGFLERFGGQSVAEAHRTVDWPTVPVVDLK